MAFNSKKKKKQPKNCQQYIYTLEYYTALKMSALQQHAITWINMSTKQ